MISHYATIDDYIARLPSDVQTIFEAVRRAIHEAVPGAEEAISYHMPKFTLDGRYLVSVGAWKHHIGMYPVHAVPEALESEISRYRSARATLRFPLSQPVPYDLMGQIAAARANPGTV